ncbi:hypothetical protein OK344_12825 [Kaistella sp. BT6-1-3]|uniref:ABC transporter permease n=1 Tax=Kaistella yananensis TaxID=2989820 RepID=A0ABT3JQT4_9FLAO|nr:hypothetical protein [Kaistella yananensis]MCW4453086.1 hypothetical protein [Kaistella yananensis]
MKFTLENLFIKHVLVTYLKYREPIWIIFWGLVGAAAGTVTFG